MAKRERLEIIRDILQIVKESRQIKATPRLRKSNLSSTRFRGYFPYLIEKGFIREINNGEKHLELTDKGYEFLEKYKTIIDFIDEFDL
jgi:predicted transcriptional regulator